MKKAKKFQQRLHAYNKKRPEAVIFIALFAVVGLIFLYQSNAATSSATFEPESGVLTGGAVVGTDASASGGSYVSFPKATTQKCINPIFTTTDPNGGITDGGFYVHNNMWNAAEAGPETLYVCAFNNWYVTSTQPNTSSVKTYPNVHKDFNNLSGDPLSKYTTIATTYAATSPHVGVYDVAYDLWLNGVGWGNGTTEIMIWTENFNQFPLSNQASTTVTFLGKTFTAYHYNDGNANVISFVPSSVMPSGNFDLMAMIKWVINNGLMPSNPTINQIGFGVEVCSTNNQPATFSFTDFSMTIN